MDLAALALIAAGLYAGWNLGANDAANCIGTAVGSGIMTFRRAVALASVFAIAGAVLQGHAVMKTMGAGITAFPLPAVAGIVAMLSAGAVVTMATAARIPVSTSQAIVGGVAGSGYGIAAAVQPDRAVRDAVNAGELVTILQCWASCPLLTAVLAYFVYRLAAHLLGRVRQRLVANKVIAWLMTISACYVAYSLGANNAGNAMGPASELGLLHPRLLALLAGAAIALGMITFGKGVADTVGKNITPLSPLGAFAAQMAAGFGIHLFSIWGIPVSTSHSIVGAVVGVGMVKGTRAVSRRKLVVIASGWLLVPLAAGLVSFAVTKGVLALGVGV